MLETRVLVAYKQVTVEQERLALIIAEHHYKLLNELYLQRLFFPQAD